MADAPVEQLIRKLGDADWQTATGAQRSLLRTGKPAVPPLCVALRGSDLTVAWRAAWVLGRIRDTAAVTPLCEIVLSGGAPGENGLRLRTYEDRRAMLRAEAAEALGLIGHPDAVEPLCSALGDSYHTIRARAAKSLEKIGPAAGPAVCRQLPALPREGLMLAAVTLGAIGDAAAVAPLCRCLEHQHWTVRRAAATALANLAERYPVIELRAAIPLLSRNLAAWPLSPAELRQASERALRAIEIRTQDLRAVPLPAALPAPDTASLPLPADLLDEDPPPAIPEARGWKQRLREWLRR